MGKKERGQIKKIIKDKGYGFIYIGKGEDDVFFHRSNVQGDFNSLKEGDKVEFEVEVTYKGTQAVNLTIKGEKGKGHIRSRKKKEVGGYYLPRDTRELLYEYPVDNYKLDLFKAIRFKTDKPVFPKKDRIDVIDEQMLQFIHEKHIKNIRKKSPDVSEIDLKTDWRMIIGLGEASPYEVNITLHHIYGIPFIPGSAIKGTVRNYIIKETFEKELQEDKDIEKLAEKDKGFCDIFGCSKNSYYGEERKGNIIFYDAYPIETPKMKLDIMTPHYTQYYSGNKPPVDSDNPNPIPFLTVEDTTFKIIIELNKKPNNEAQTVIGDESRLKKGKILDITKKYLLKALKEQGIGAKTAVGYGKLSRIK